MIFWLYGRSGVGKTTLATKLEAELWSRSVHAILLDGDELRSGVSRDLGFGVSARTENHRRAAEIALLLAKRGFVVVVATMAPQYAQRDVAHLILNGYPTRWIYVDAPLEVCAQRDPKGLYSRATSGEIKNLREFPFDTPRRQDLHLHLMTENASSAESFAVLQSFVTNELADHPSSGKSVRSKSQ
jgi:adenylyl-sulfate kinase